MEWLNTYVSAANGAFQLAPGILQSVCVNAPAHVAASMVNHVMLVAVAQSHVGHERIAVDRSAFLYVFGDFRLQHFLFAGRNYERSNFTVTLQDPTFLHPFMSWRTSNESSGVRTKWQSK